MLGQLVRYFKRRVAKVERGLWVFTSFDGHYSDSPKYVSMALHEIKPDAKIVWLVNKKFLPLLPDYVLGVDIESDEAEYYRGRAEIVVDNVYCGRVYSRMSDTFLDKVKERILYILDNKRSQRAYTTWHATPLKCIGRDQVGNTVYSFSCPGVTMFWGNQFTIDTMRHVTFDKLKMQLIGTPRNDILFSDEEKAFEMRKKLGLPIDKKIVMYAPTFRNDGRDVEGKNVLRSGINQMDEIDFDRLFAALSERFGGDWVFLCRFHYHVEKLVDWEGLNKRYEGRFINGNLHDDMAEYLLCTDLLITDASSSMFDYSVSGHKPCLLYFPDLENYQSKERGLYVDVTKLPYPLAVTFEELERNIRSFDEEKYKADVDALLQEFGFVDDAHSSERIVNYILGDCK